MIGRAILTAVNDSTELQQASVNLLAGESKDLVEVFHSYGFVSSAPNGSECIMLSMGGNRDHGVIIASEHRDSRLKALLQGDTALYNESGTYIWIEGTKIKIFLETLTVKNTAGKDMIERSSDFKQKVIDGRILTALGPQSWITADKVPMQLTKDDFDLFKE